MIVSACHNGGTSYGIRVSSEDRDRYFSKTRKNIYIKIPRKPEFSRRLTNSFWGVGREVRGSAFRDWFEELGYVKKGKRKWKNSKPPQFRLTPQGSGRFKLAKA